MNSEPHDPYAAPAFILLAVLFAFLRFGIALMRD
jgi:hypothetical protein